MLHELSIQDLNRVVGGNTKVVPTNTIYVDEDGTIHCGTPPWAKPRPWPIVPLVPPKLPKPKP